MAALASRLRRLSLARRARLVAAAIKKLSLGRRAVGVVERAKIAVKRLSLGRRGKEAAAAVKRLSLGRRGKEAAAAVKRLSLGRRGLAAAKRAKSAIRRLSLPRRAKSLVNRASLPRRWRGITSRAQALAAQALVASWSYLPASVREAVEEIVAVTLSVIHALWPVFATAYWSLSKLTHFLKLLLHASIHLPLTFTLATPRVAGSTTNGRRFLPFKIISSMASSMARKLWPTLAQLRTTKLFDIGAALKAATVIALRAHPAWLMVIATILVIVYALPAFIEYNGDMMMLKQALDMGVRQVDVGLKRLKLPFNLNSSPWPLLRHRLTLVSTFLP